VQGYIFTFMEHPSHIWISDDFQQETLTLNIYKDQNFLEQKLSIKKNELVTSNTLSPLIFMAFAVINLLEPEFYI